MLNCDENGKCQMQSQSHSNSIIPTNTIDRKKNESDESQHEFEEAQTDPYGYSPESYKNEFFTPSSANNGYVQSFAIAVCGSALLLL